MIMNTNSQTMVTKKAVMRLGFILLIVGVPFVLAACGKSKIDDAPAPGASQSIVFPASYVDGGSDTNAFSPINIRIDGDGSLESSRVLPAIVSPANSIPEDVGVYSAPNVDSTEVTSKLVGQNIVFSRTGAGVTVSSAGNLIIRTIVGNNVTTIIKAKLVDDAQWIDFDSVTVHLIGADGVGSVGTKVSVATEAELASAKVNDIPLVKTPTGANKLRVFYNKGTTSVDASNPDVYVTNSNTDFFATELVFAGNEGKGKGWYLLVLPKDNSVGKTATITVKSVEGGKVAMFKVKSVAPVAITSADFPTSYVTGSAPLSYRIDATNTTTPAFSDIDVRVPTAAGKSVTTIPASFLPSDANLGELGLILYNLSSTTIMPNDVVAEFNAGTGMLSFDFKNVTNLQAYYTLKLLLGNNKFERIAIVPVLDADWAAVTSLDLVQAKDRHRVASAGTDNDGGTLDATAASAATADAFDTASSNTPIDIKFYAANSMGPQSPAPNAPTVALKNEPGEVGFTNKFLIRFNDTDINEFDAVNNPGVKVVISGADASSFTYDLFQIADHSYWLNIAASAASKSATFTVTSLEDSTKVAVIKVTSTAYVTP